MMELNDIYKFANIINEGVMNGEIDKDVLDNVSIKIKVAPNILYGIDKEFYRISHDDNIEGFEHSNKVVAKINAITFEIVS